METFKQFASRMNGYKIKKPTNVYFFVRSGTKSPLKDHGERITRNAYSTNQAVRYLKLSYPEYFHDDIKAVVQAPEDTISQNVPRRTIELPKQPSKPTKSSEQLTFNNL